MFRKEVDPKEQMKAQKKVLKGEQRGMSREVRDLERQEARIILDVKKKYKMGDKRGAEAMAKQLVQIRKTKTRMLGMNAQISGVSANMTSMSAQVQMTKTMASTSKVMGKVNEQMNVQEIQSIMNKFSQENDKMDMKSELMDDALDGMFDDDAEADDLVNEVLDGLGIEMGSQLSGVGVPSKAPKSKVQANEIDDDMIRRLAALSD